MKDQSRPPPLRFRPGFVGFLRPDTDPGAAVTDAALCVVSAIAVKKRFLSTIVRRSASHAVLDALRPLCGAPRHTAVLQGQ
ncbi:hypothetical protein CUB86_28190 [Pseudomonas syringae pv. actinidiae]|uniref:Uncharacterized protein n=1 Tax=Pseudomonas syringae pv. actinidiae TaxID=103796 RepID=A0AAU8XEH4_PSESF|nr:hypothetical protein CT122_07705 [Pseudomonas syringae pv. actinidiae]PIN58330.1 hypothetical protein CUB86_28190 [Pseudomonas syringae pv. actinidiae]